MADQRRVAGQQLGIVQFAAQKNGGGGTLTLSGKNTYSGSTRIDQGATIKLAGEGTIGLPTASKSFTGPLRIYGPGTPGINPTSTGTITVTGYAPVVLGAARSGNTLTLSWQGVYKLQSATNSITGPWFDYPAGGTSPVQVTLDQTKAEVFFRLSTY